MIDIKTLQESLEQFEDNTIALTESDVRAIILSLRIDGDQDEQPTEWLAESMAFEFFENHSYNKSCWDTYFGPMMSMQNDAGQMVEIPSIHLVTEDMLNYWTRRSNETQHPVLRARYAGLVWDFTKFVTEKSADVAVAHALIESIIEIASTDCHKQKPNVINKLKHALVLSISLNDVSRIQAVRDTILEYEDKVSADSKLGLWGFSFDLLWGNKKVELSDEQKIKIIDDLENRLSRVSNLAEENSIDQWAAKAAAIRLAKHYRSLGNSSEMQRVLKMYGQALEIKAQPAVAMLASSWMQQLYRVYREFHLHDEAAQVLIKLRKLGPKVNQGLKTISTDYEISKKEMNQYVEAMLEGNLDKALQRIAVHYIPKHDETVIQVKELAKEAPISFLCTRQLLDNKGRPTATIGPLDNDLDGHVINQTSQNMQFTAVFFREVVIELIERHQLTPDLLIEYLYKAPLFDEDNSELISRGLKAYFDGETTVAIHLLIPQIENGIRNLLELTGGSVLNQGRNGGFQLKVLGELLRDSKIIGFLGDDNTKYLRILFTDPRGINLRNKVCHGICSADELGFTYADRVIHILLILALVRSDNQTISNEQSVI